MEKKIRIIGLGPGENPSPEMFSGCGRVVASSRLLDLAPPKMKKTAITPVRETMDEIAAQRDDGVVVLVGGDPLFFGIGRLLINRFGPEAVEIRPGVSTVQALAARLKIPWDDAVFLSLHGRRHDRDAVRLLMNRKTFVFTDRENTPAALAQAMLNRLETCGCGDLADDYRVHVGEDLGRTGERVRRFTLARAAAEKTFSPLNLVLVERTGLAAPARLFPGEKDISHSRGLITKDEVRAAAMAAIDPPESGVMWDIGAGSGSVGLTCALLRPGLEVLAVEKRDEEIANIHANIKKFRAFNLTAVTSPAPEGLAGLPNPERIFIGGSDGQIVSIIDSGHARLAPGGRMVVNAVLEKTKKAAIRTMEDLGMRPSSSRIAVSRGHANRNLTELNPITIITGTKK